MGEGEKDNYNPVNFGANPYHEGCLVSSHTQSCCIASSYGGEDYYEWEAVVVITN